MGDLKQTNRETGGAENNIHFLKIQKDTQHITIANKINSPFLRLPTEIRRKIFRYATTADGGKIYLRLPTIYPVAIFLPQVCRQLLAETETMCYERNTFCFPEEPIASSGLKTFFKMYQWIYERSEAQKLALRQLEITFRQYHFNVMASHLTGQLYPWEPELK